MTWLAVGLGNPGERYARTRHNVGARVVERVAERQGVRFRKVRFLPLDVAETRVDGERLLLARPRTFMNVSGPPVASYARRAGVDRDHLVAVHDEIDLALGALKVKKGGSTAGHNGLNSLVGAARTPDFFRIRLGVGRPPGRQDPADFVLKPFAKHEQEEVELLVEDAADALISLVLDGLAVTVSRYNRTGAKPSRE
jgi:PTH1 family peptidyl-tRNA hydrolase